MKLSDYVARFLADQGVRHVFGVTGGAVVHMFDSAARNGLRCVFNHHEQASALAAEAYSRVSNNIGVAYVTSGPGGTNAITGVSAAWLDSIPCVYISGQSRLAHTTRGRSIRQLGNQQMDIVSIVKSITKYAVMLEDATRIRYELEKAISLARGGRPGPVWLDIPLDLQWAEVDPEQLDSYGAVGQVPCESSAAELGGCLDLLRRCRRPVAVIGTGVRLSGGQEEVRRLLAKADMPYVTTWNATDMFAAAEGHNLGRLGIFGQRGANLAVQNCDLLLCLGCHLSIPLTGANYGAFARAAKVIVVDIDPAELECQTRAVDLPVLSDCRAFLRGVLASEDVLVEVGQSWGEWRDICAVYQTKYNRIPSEWGRSAHVNAYVFTSQLSQELGEEDVIVVDGGGTVNQVAFQTIEVKRGQRVIVSAAIVSMGTGLPESIGAHMARPDRRTICLVGDGGFQFNIQELQTLAGLNLAIKVFVYNNSGYLSIRNTQDAFLGGRHLGSEMQGGLSMPDIVKVAKAYGIRTARICSQTGMRDQIREVLAAPGPVVCDVIIPPDQAIIPCQGFDMRPDGSGAPRPLEDMYPYLPREEFREVMIVAPWAEP